MPNPASREELIERASFADRLIPEDREWFIYSAVVVTQEAEKQGEIDQEIFLALAGLKAAHARRRNHHSFSFWSYSNSRIDAEDAYKAALMAGDDELAATYLDEFEIDPAKAEIVQKETAKRLEDPGYRYRMMRGTNENPASR